jgi:hypothetical protein
MLNKDTDREHLAGETNAAGVETVALPEPEEIEEISLEALPHAQPKMSVAYDPSTMIRNGMDGATQQAAQESGFAIGASQDGLTEAEREEKKKKDEEFHEALSGAMEEQKERQERERQEAHAKAWDDAMHDFGGKKVRGSEITAAYDYYKKNREKIIEQMIADGKSRQQAEDLARILDERARIWEKMRLGTATPEETERYNTTSKIPEVQNQEAKIQSAAKADAESSIQNKDLKSQSTALDELERYKSLSQTPDVQNFERKAVEAPQAQQKAQVSIDTANKGNADFPSAAALKVQENFQSAANGNELISQPAAPAAPPPKLLVAAAQADMNF